MKLHLEFGSLSHEEEAKQLAAILGQCFAFPNTERYFHRLGLENFRVVREGGRIVGGLGIYQMGQWFGGKSVAMAGLAAVGVPPEQRGTGVAFELLSQTLQELHEREVPISALYPATQRLYRKVGYEQGGNACLYEIPTNSIGLSDRTLPIQPVSPINYKIFSDIYCQSAIKINGNLDRHQAIWEAIIQPRELWEGIIPLREHEVIYAYLVGAQSQPEGYIIFHQNAKESQLVILDWVALTIAAAKRLWTFVADHRSQIKTATWRGSVIHPLLLFLPEQTAKVKNSSIWMLRIIDVAKALSERGYPAGVEAELHLTVQDDLLTGNNGNFILRVSGGSGEVTRGGKGELQLNIRGLSPLYTGLYTPHQLQFSGFLEATEKALATATQIFAGSVPWMADFF
ncbi:GNAT family N-acetyltransferase [Phormidium sp. LEGE 05292]|uniref:GNAT family N-acetyltransferase n=1 Tax=[Phormidium] sp. LEGE 05292 TaxID=767427 RepID=UPI00187E9615|nr:GNAT family N-acetyltransferase [Phormidium sp. LEGE 05292]MBE9227723.1 GNAT family N-acetyltransferase [Phormidium sp. LEGE 05292]